MSVRQILLIQNTPPKCHRVFDKLKNKIQSFIVRFCFYFNMKNEIQIIEYYFHVKIDFCLKFLMLIFLFHFHKKWKRNSLFFVFHFYDGIEKRITETDENWHYDYFYKYDLHVIQKQVRVKSSKIYRRTIVVWTPRIWCFEETANTKKQLMYFHVYITTFSLLLLLMLLPVNCHIKHINRSSYSLNIVKVDLKFK